MAKIMIGNFDSDGASEVFTASKFTILLGNETNEDFGGGTVSVQVRQSQKVDWTTNSTYTSKEVLTSIEYTGGLRVRLVLEGATNPNLDYTIKYE